MGQAPALDGVLFDASPFGQDGFAAPEVDHPHPGTFKQIPKKGVHWIISNLVTTHEKPGLKGVILERRPPNMGLGGHAKSVGNSFRFLAKGPAGV